MTGLIISDKTLRDHTLTKLLILRRRPLEPTLAQRGGMEEKHVPVDMELSVLNKNTVQQKYNKNFL